MTDITPRFIPADEDTLSSLLPSGRTAIVKTSSGSTNADLLACIRDGQTNMLITAATQTSGRGRLGRSFASDIGGIYFSFDVSMPKDDISSLLSLTPLAGVSAATFLRDEYGLDVKLKWINDLYLCGKKLAGILVETVVIGDTAHAVVGIGINAQNSGFPETATSLSRHTDACVNANNVISSIVTRFISRVPQICDDTLINDYRALSCVIGKSVTVHTFDGAPDYIATAVDIDRDFSLVVRTDAGLRNLSSAEVSVRI